MHLSNVEKNTFHSLIGEEIRNHRGALFLLLAIASQNPLPKDSDSVLQVWILANTLKKKKKTLQVIWGVRFVIR